MKRIVLLVLLWVLWTLPGAACSCFYGMQVVWPRAPEVPQHGVFVLEYPSLDRKLLAHLAENTLAYLSADKQQIPLRIRETYTCLNGAKQFVLVPEMPLEVGKSYVLVTRGRKKYFGARFDRGQEKRRYVKGWTVVPDSVVSELKWKREPQVAGKTDVCQWGPACGSDERIKIGFSLADTAYKPIAITIVAVRKVGSESPVTLCVALSNHSLLLIGSGSYCDQNLVLQNKTEYEAHISLMDGLGRLLPSATPLRFIPVTKRVARRECENSGLVGTRVRVRTRRAG